MSENPGSLQVESPSGKRSKVKAAHVLLRFTSSIAHFMEQAQNEASTLDVDFLWECCGEDEFTFEQLATEYYGHQPSAVEAAAIAMRLHGAPVYFYRKGKGRYKTAPADTLKAALAALERKRLLNEKIAAWVEQLKAQTLPEAFADKIDMLLYAPDKNSPEWKALERATAETSSSGIKLLADCGAIASPHDYHLGAFLREYFPAGTDFPPFEPSAVQTDWPRVDVIAFSVDDSMTTEIDDAFSLQLLDNGNTRVGIHIAVPALAVAPGSTLDGFAMQRLSTIYIPGRKITMLPATLVEQYSLVAGSWRPVLSLYLEVTAEFDIVHRESRLEEICVADNLRLAALEPWFNENTLADLGEHPYREQLLYLYRLAEALEKARGKHDPTRPQQVDYSFQVENGRVHIVERQRGAPLDKLVSELMIAANSHWGGLLDSHNIAGIYRAQAGGKVYMTVKAEQHQGLGVTQYAWCTSPLRRMVDLVNQRQLLAVLQEPAQAQQADFLGDVMHGFQLAYSAYSEFQNRMERYWCLQYLLQEQMEELVAVVWRENLVRLERLPLVTKVHNLPEVAVGSKVRLQIKRVDLLLLELETRFLAIEVAEPVTTMSDVVME